jgi:hypothetical protein
MCAAASMIQGSPQRYRDQPPDSRHGSYRPLVSNFIPGHHHAELTLPISRTCASAWAAWVPPEVVRASSVTLCKYTVRPPAR